MEKARYKGDAAQWLLAQIEIILGANVSRIEIHV